MLLGQISRTNHAISFRQQQTRGMEAKVMEKGTRLWSQVRCHLLGDLV